MSLKYYYNENTGRVLMYNAQYAFSPKYVETYWGYRPTQADIKALERLYSSCNNKKSLTSIQIKAFLEA